MLSRRAGLRKRSREPVSDVMKQRQVARLCWIERKRHNDALLPDATVLIAEVIEGAATPGGSGMRAKIEMAIALAATVIAAVVGSVVGYVLYTRP
ncbi:MAG TPA: hypothetical protein VGU20_21425 [Stellaceae bacterium]|nr:hypothetical protein [Stellaceae bacterium]